MMRSSKMQTTGQQCSQIFPHRHRSYVSMRMLHGIFANLGIFCKIKRELVVVSSTYFNVEHDDSTHSIKHHNFHTWKPVTLSGSRTQTHQPVVVSLCCIFNFSTSANSCYIFGNIYIVFFFKFLAFLLRFL